MTEFHFLIPRDLLLTQNQRLHRMQVAQRARRLREMGYAAGLADPEPIPTPCVMDVLIGWPDARRRDRSNAAPPTVKPLLDGLVDAGVLPDDSDDLIVAETYRSHIARDKGLVRIDLTLTPQETHA